MNDIKKYTEANKSAWNEVMPRHQTAAKEKLDKLFSQPGFIVQKNKDLLSLFNSINVNGKDIIHLCCNNGSELMSLKNMGAGKCTGIDISEYAVKEAKERAAVSNIDCEFICLDVFDIQEKFFNSYDIVYLTSGCLGWIPDLNKFFSIVAKLLRTNGLLLIHEIHPFSETLPFDDNDIENRLQIIEPYFRTEPIIENESLDYIGKTKYKAKTHYWFVHTLSHLIMSIISNGMNITNFIESDTDISAGHGKIQKLNAKIPLSFIMTAVIIK